MKIKMSKKNHNVDVAGPAAGAAGHIDYLPDNSRPGYWEEYADYYDMPRNSSRGAIAAKAVTEKVLIVPEMKRLVQKGLPPSALDLSSKPASKINTKTQPKLESRKLDKIAVKAKEKTQPIKRVTPVENKIQPRSTPRTAPVAMSKPKMRVGTAPVAIGYSTKGSKHVFSGNGPTMIVSHKEYVGDVASTGATFNASVFSILQPGDPNAFPWLSALAGRFEMYRLKRLTFSYLPACSSSTAGTVMLAFDRVAGRAVPKTKTEILEYEDSLREVPWMGGNISVKNISDKKYTLFGNNYNQTAQLLITGTASGGAGPLTAATDVKTFAIGQLYVGCDGVSQATVGEVWMEYQIELLNPGVFAIPGIMLHPNQATAGSTSAPWSATGPLLPNGNLQLVGATSTNCMYEMPPGQYFLCFSAGITGTGESGTIVVTAPAGGNATVTQTQQYQSSTAESSVYFDTSSINVTTGGLVLFTATGFSKLSTYTSLRITAYNYLLFG
jgi:hypothetical protein